jgi:hypothetical protein
MGHVVHADDDAAALKTPLPHEHGEQISLLDLREVPWAEAYAGEERRQHADRRLLRAYDWQRDDVLSFSLEVVQDRRLSARGRPEQELQRSSRAEMLQRLLLLRPEPDGARRRACEELGRRKSVHGCSP